MSPVPYSGTGHKNNHYCRDCLTVWRTFWHESVRSADLWRYRRYRCWYAGKDVLSNFFSGIMLYFDRPFSIGDWIRSPDRNIEGTVAEIGWRITRINTFDHRPLYVPNSVFSSISVENPGRMTNRRIKTVIGLRYEDADKIGLIVDAIRNMLQAHSDIDQKQTLLVYFNEFADSSLNIMVYCFTKTTVWQEWLAVQAGCLPENYCDCPGKRR
ncbi:MscS family inner membrane protein YnaI [Salmonella enterica subsp. enterica]|nr:MscS family inner membrane protein YnaI [Salmonella enterica subsp. enterica]